MKRAERLSIEQLEERHLPSTFGVPWPDALHLKLSFVPDGTPVDGSPSVLFQSLNSQASISGWQREILRAVNTWAAKTNINVGLVADDGEPIGAPGAIEGDPRFGDIRVAARPLPGDVLALSSPFDPVAGTRSGDIILNSSLPIGIGSTLGQFDLMTVVLHEAGHSFGLPDNTASNSAMFAAYDGRQSWLSTTDIANIRSMYGGRRAQDVYEGPTGNDTFATASPINILDVSADLTNAGGVDYYKFTMPPNALNTVMVQVQSAGTSLLVPQLTVFDATQSLVAAAEAPGPRRNTVAVTLTNVQPGATYFFKVSGASDVFAIGAYRLQIYATPNATARIQALDAVYDGTSTRNFVVDQHTDDSLGTSTPLAYEQDPRFDFTVNAAISDANDVDWYSVTSPTSLGGGWSPQTLIASVSALDSAALYPTVTVYDQSATVVNADVVVNSAGATLVQVPNAMPGSTYYLKVDAAANAGSHNTGNYVLGVNFGSTSLALPPMAGNTLSSPSSGVVRDVYTLSVPESQVISFTLSVSSPSATVPVGVRMRVYDKAGNIVFTLDAFNGQTVSGQVLLQQGTYTVVFTAATQDGSALPALTYGLRAKSITDPMDPVPIDPLNPPLEDPTLIGGGTLPPDPAGNPWVPLL